MHLLFLLFFFQMKKKSFKLQPIAIRKPNLFNLN